MTVAEGFQSEEVQEASNSAFFFAETAMKKAATGDPQSIALLLSMGGIPGSKTDNGSNSIKEAFKNKEFNTKEYGQKVKQNWNDILDKGKLNEVANEIAGEATKTAKGWENPKETLKTDVKNAVEAAKNAAKEFREKLRNQKKGKGAHEVGQKLIDEVTKKTSEDIANNSNKKNGPCNTGVFDPVTGKTFIRNNFSKNIKGKAEYAKFVEEAHPIIKNRIKARQKLIDEGKMPPETDIKAGRHSEVRALDAAIKAREAKTGKAVTEGDLGSFDLHNRHMPSNTPMNRCGNCSSVTDGVNVVGGHK